MVIAPWWWLAEWSRHWRREGCWRWAVFGGEDGGDHPDASIGGLVDEDEDRLSVWVEVGANGFEGEWILVPNHHALACTIYGE